MINLIPYISLFRRFTLFVLFPLHRAEAHSKEYRMGYDSGTTGVYGGGVKFVFRLSVLRVPKKTLSLWCVIVYNLKIIIMRVISSSELRNNMEKYLDLAADEKIVIQRGRNETFVLMREDYLAPDEDLKRAVSAQELLVGIEADVRKAFREKYGDRV